MLVPWMCIPWPLLHKASFVQWQIAKWMKRQSTIKMHHKIFSTASSRNGMRSKYVNTMDRGEQDHFFNSMIKDPGAYSQHIIFFINNHCTQKARVLHNTRLERLARDKHFSLFYPFVSYEENEALWIRPLVPYSQHSIFFVTYKSAQ